MVAQFLAGSRGFLLVQIVETCSWAEPTSCSVDTVVFLPGSKVTRMWSSPLSWGLECLELYLYFPYTLSWRAQGQIFLFSLPYLSMEASVNVYRTTLRNSNDVTLFWPLHYYRAETQYFCYPLFYIAWPRVIKSEGFVIFRHKSNSWE
jgi:hypothetical protein